MQVKPAVDLTAEKGAAARVYPKNPSQLIANDGAAAHAAAAAATFTLVAAQAGTLNGHLAEMMGDAPPCDGCGHTTVRNGACYKCLNCGNSMGCS